MSQDIDKFKSTAEVGQPDPPVMLNWNTGGTTQFKGYYWMIQNFGTENQTEPRIRELFPGYNFCETTKWAGPLTPPCTLEQQEFKATNPMQSITGRTFDA